MKYIWCVSTTLACLFSIGCANDNFPKYQTLGGFRVLGIQANTPEISVSSLPAIINLTPILSDLGSGGRMIAISGSACVDPGVSVGADPSCAGVPGKVDLTIASVNPTPVGSNSQLFGTPSLTGSTPSFTVTVPAGISAGRSSTELFNGIGYLVSLEFRAGSEVRRAYKRIVVSNKPTVNVNPSITAILANGSTLAALPATKVGLTVQVSGQGSYQSMNGSGAVTVLPEILRATYFSSDGVLLRSRVAPLEENFWTPPAVSPVGRPTSIVVVVYDEIGGMAFQILDM